MSDLSSELRQVADAAAHHARPLPAAEVIRRGDRRRRRNIAQRSLGGLSAVGVASLAGVMILTGGPVASQAASGGATHPPGFTAVTDSTSSAAGTMTLHVSYQVQRHGMVRVLSVTCSGHSNARIRHGFLFFEIDERAPGKAGLDFFAVGRLKHTRNGDFSGSLAVRSITTSAKKHHGLILVDDSTMRVGLSMGNPVKKPTVSAAAAAPLQLGLILTGSSVR